MIIYQNYILFYAEPICMSTPQVAHVFLNSPRSPHSEV